MALISTKRLYHDDGHTFFNSEGSWADKLVYASPTSGMARIAVCVLGILTVALFLPLGLIAIFWANDSLYYEIDNSVNKPIWLAVVPWFFWGRVISKFIGWPFLKPYALMRWIIAGR